ncbi:helix-turn-helix transcriptional regulator [Paenibacillus sp. FSL W7-1287]|uniref:helix-turn-helix transcriptional regulator n=1 Tax=Paenibacillus sp. FSL W7-1287 TaxID=2954538 RepID=UPI0030F7FE1A
MRADRLLSIMVLLQNYMKMTTKELATRLEVSERTILRDMDALSTAGVPVVAERGPAGGWRLMEHFQSQLSGLKLEEMKALFILPSEQVLEDLGVQAYGVDIREKLLAATPPTTKSAGRNFLEKLYIDTSTWKQSKLNNKNLLIVQQALWEDMKLHIVYQKTDGERTKRVVSPLGLVAKGSTWYLVALNEEHQYRSFRLSRIVQAEQVEEGFTRPEQFQLSEYWKQSTLSFVEALPSFQVEVEVDPAIMGRLTFTDKFVDITTIGDSHNGQPTPVTLTFNTEQEAISYILGFGAAMTITQPEYLREKVVLQAQLMIKMYE